MSSWRKNCICSILTSYCSMTLRAASHFLSSSSASARRSLRSAFCSRLPNRLSSRSINDDDDDGDGDDDDDSVASCFDAAGGVASASSCAVDVDKSPATAVVNVVLGSSSLPLFGSSTRTFCLTALLWCTTNTTMPQIQKIDTKMKTPFAPIIALCFEIMSNALQNILDKDDDELDDSLLARSSSTNANNGTNNSSSSNANNSTNRCVECADAFAVLTCRQCDGTLRCCVFVCAILYSFRSFGANCVVVVLFIVAFLVFFVRFSFLLFTSNCVACVPSVRTSPFVSNIIPIRQTSTVRFAFARCT